MIDSAEMTYFRNYIDGIRVEFDSHDQESSEEKTKGNQDKKGEVKNQEEKKRRKTGGEQGREETRNLHG